MGETQRAAHTILIVDDDQENIEIVGRKLSPGPFRCLGENTGEKGFDAACREQPDIIILDWQLPGASGIEVVERLKADPRVSSIPVIIMTGVMRDSEHLQRAFDAGASDFLRKPVDTVELNSRVKSILELQREQRNRIRLERELFAQQKKALQGEIENREKDISELSLQFVLNNRIAERFIGFMEGIIENPSGNFNRDECEAQITGFKKELFSLYWENIEKRFSESHIGFKKRLADAYPELNENDLRLCLLCKMNLSSGEIAEMTFVSYEGVRKARSRIRKKLKIDSHLDLSEFLKNFT